MKHIKIKSAPAFSGGWCAKFTIGVQTFSLAPVQTKEDADWYCRNLQTAFKNLIEAAVKDQTPKVKKVSAKKTVETEKKNSGK